MGRARGVDDLERFEAGVLHPFEQRLAATEQDGGDIERQLVDRLGGERLADGGGAAGDVDPKPVGRCCRASNAASNPSVTKWNVVPPSISIGSCG